MCHEEIKGRHRIWLVGKVLVLHAQNPGFHSHHHIYQGSHTTVIPTHSGGRDKMIRRPWLFLLAILWIWVLSGMHGIQKGWKEESKKRREKEREENGEEGTERERTGKEGWTRKEGRKEGRQEGERTEGERILVWRMGFIKRNKIETTMYCNE